MAHALVMLPLLLAACAPGGEAETYGAQRRVARAYPDQVYYLYLPEGFEPTRRWPVWVNVHPTDGDGRTMLLTWERYADDHGFVIVSPTFGPGYNRLAGKEDERLLAILEEVGEEVPIEERVFLVGFSGGAQFAHRFAFRHPERVLGVSAMSAGQYDPPPVGGVPVPFLVTVGGEDCVDPDRVALAQEFARTLEEAGYPVALEVIPGVAHAVSDRAITLTVAFFERLHSAYSPSENTSAVNE
jgi:predicted esterase